MAQPCLKGVGRAWVGEQAGNLSWTPALWVACARSGVGKGSKKRRPQGLPGGRALPCPPEGNPSPRSPNVVCPQGDLQLSQHLSGLLNSPLKLGAKNRGVRWVDSGLPQAHPLSPEAAASPPPITGLSRLASLTTSAHLPNGISILRLGVFAQAHTYLHTKTYSTRTRTQTNPYLGTRGSCTFKHEHSRYTCIAT